MKLKSLEVSLVELPFKEGFRHSTRERITSQSIFLKCVAEDGETGYGEALPREYVTGESAEGAFELLSERIAPMLLHEDFESWDEVINFLRTCAGRPPKGWTNREQPAQAAWCAVDLGLLDTFGKVFKKTVRLSEASGELVGCRFSAVVSLGDLKSYLLTLCKIRLYGISNVKLKVDKHIDEKRIRLARAILGKHARIRVDANAAWEAKDSASHIRMLRSYGINTIEQPFAHSDTAALARLVSDGVEVVADEGIHDEKTLEEAVHARTYTTVNIRISKCGGLIAAFDMAKKALARGLEIQIGCQVGESSLLSAAHLSLLPAVTRVKYVEGCFGKHLLREDPVDPLLQFGYGGKPPALPSGTGLGVRTNEDILRRWTIKSYRLPNQAESLRCRSVC